VVGYVLGVDIGTTYTAAAVARDGRLELVTLGLRASEMPSVAFLRDDGTMLFGEPAERRGVTEPTRLAREFKRRLGDPTPVILGSAPMSAHALVGRLLADVVATVTEREGGPAHGVVVTRPANWGPYKVELFAQALDVAGIGPAATITEPEAAAAFYAATRDIVDGEMLAVYDLGGGTFDATVVRRTGDSFAVVGEPTGIEHLGGVDFDEAVFVHTRHALGDAVEEVDADDPAAAAAVARLRRDCVEAKEALSSDTQVSIPVTLPGVRTEVRLTRAEFEDMIRPSLDDTIRSLRRTLAAAEVEPADLAAVVLVGGSSRIPLVAQMVVDALGRPVAVDVHPTHAVALGAAVRGSLTTAPAPSAAQPADERPAPPAGDAGQPPRPRRVPRRAIAGALVGLAAVAAAVIGAVVAAGGNGADPREVTVTVDSTEEWTDTGVTLAGGEEVRLSASGSIGDDQTRPAQRFGPDGAARAADDPHFRDPWPELPHAGLIARVGTDDPFFVGHDLRLDQAPAGPLRLGVNDFIYTDNDGTFEVRVEVRP